MPDKTCTGCGDDVDPLAVFPGGLCVDCFERSEAGQRAWSTEEIVRAFGGSR